MKESFYKIWAEYEHKPAMAIAGLLIVAIYFASGFLNDRITIFSGGNDIQARGFDTSQSKPSECPQQIMWWTYENNIVKLNYNNLIINKNNIYIYGKKHDDTFNEMTQKEFASISKDYNGSFIASTEPLRYDVDNDGIVDSVLISAKADTLFTQGFRRVDTHFNDDRFPLEVVRVGTNELAVYFNKKLLSSGSVDISYGNRSYKNRRTDIRTGRIVFDDINVLRNNVNILYQREGIYYLASYAMEGHQLLSGDHISALTDVSVVLLASAVLIYMVSMTRRFIRRAKNE